MVGVSIRLYWWQFGIAIASVIALYTNSSVAQITPDATLPNNSIVTENGRTFDITGGSTAGGNLFHSFQDFSIPTGSGATFNNAVEIQNIISRVTGNSISNIDGLIKAEGGANLFLINPNGIIFGQNARLDIGGSFLATSANSIKFGDGFEFSAVNTESQPLLTVTAPVGLQFGIRSGLIGVQGDGQGARIDADSPIIDTQNALRVEPDKTLALVGGDINLEGATLKTAGGRIELGSVAGNSLVTLTSINKGFALGYSDIQNFGNVALSQQATVDASGEGGGDIQVQAKRITVINGSQIQTSTLRAKQGGDLVVNATEYVEASGSSSNLFAFVYPRATGNAGNLTINTRELLVRDGAFVSASTFGTGKGGNLIVSADNIQMIGTSFDGEPSKLFATAESSATGTAGDLTINTRELLVRDGAQVGTGTFGAGKGGNFTVTADNIQVISANANGFGSALSTQANRKSTGDAGNLTINTRELLVRDGAQVNTGTFGAGNGGSLALRADRVQVIGINANGRSASNLTSQANPSATGNAGNLTINTRELLVRDGARVAADTSGAGKAGNLDIQASELLVRDGGQVGAGTFGSGNGGNFAISAGSIQVIGTNANGIRSALSVQTQGTGNAGDLTINTRELLIRDRAFVSAATSSAGKGGNLAITANNIQIIGASSLSAQTGLGVTGDAGDLIINTRGLLIRDGGSANVTTFGTGKGGNLAITANNIQIIGTDAAGNGSYLSAQASLGATGDAGDLTINTRELLVQDEAFINVSTRNVQAKAGNITVDANSIQMNNGASLNANTQGGGGNIVLNSPLLLLRRGSNITTNASGNNITGGNINIDVKNGFIVAVPLENSNIRADSANFRGGNVIINNTAGIFGIQASNNPSGNTSEITAKGATPDLSGNIQIPTPDVDPSSGLIELPVNVVDVSRQISNACIPGNLGFENTFTVTGRGGLPISPTEALQDQSTYSAWVRFKGEPESNTVRINKPDLIATSAPPIIEASSWIADKSGNIELVAPASQSPQTPHSASCSELNQN